MASSNIHGIIKDIFIDVSLPSEERQRFYQLSLTREKDFDFTIKFKGKEYKVHEKVISSNTMFDAMTRSNMMEVLPENRCVTLKHERFTHARVELFIKFLYTRVMLVNHTNFVDVWAMADFFLEQPLREFCKNTVKVSLKSWDRLLNIYKMIQDEDELPEVLIDYMVTHIAEDFENFLSSEEFSSAPKDLVLAVLSSDDLYLFDESVALQAACKWISCNRNEKPINVHEFIAKLRFDFLPHQQSDLRANVRSIMTEDIISVYNDYLQLHLLPNRTSDVARKYVNGIYFMGDNEIVRYNHTTNQISALASYEDENYIRSHANMYGVGQGSVIQPKVSEPQLLSVSFKIALNTEQVNKKIRLDNSNECKKKMNVFTDMFLENGILRGYIYWHGQHFSEAQHRKLVEFPSFIIPEYSKNISSTLTVRRRRHSNRFVSLEAGSVMNEITKNTKIFRRNNWLIFIQIDRSTDMTHKIVKLNLEELMEDPEKSVELQEMSIKTNFVPSTVFATNDTDDENESGSDMARKHKLP